MILSNQEFTFARGKTVLKQNFSRIILLYGWFPCQGTNLDFAHFKR